MFGRTVKLDGKEYFVGCTPKTPFSEILSRAAAMAKAEETASKSPNDQSLEYVGEGEVS
jgi:hypothetical protein